MASLIWEPIDPKIHTALEAVLRDWKATPFREGLSTKGVGADCIRFTTSVLDELYKRPHTKIPRLSPDASLHNTSAVRSLIEFIKKHFPSDPVTDSIINPGDVITERRGNEVGHTLIVGPRKNTLWHTLRPVGVCITGIGSLGEIVHIERPRNKDSWAHYLE